MDVIAEMKNRKAELQQELAALDSGLNAYQKTLGTGKIPGANGLSHLTNRGALAASSTGRKGHTMSAATRKKISLAAKKRWASMGKTGTAKKTSAAQAAA